ncbi:ATP-binding cassette, subfamily B [Flexibacter flexilis DSM 6793]|uniref:ATP-binding cassette, subfamily B n=1 Tax=Flexibacter flexilis DSM 6793 TaxID=927664 RepID=A0A1I1KMU3_9BACT|nr:ABC transporter ATP-binding protein [Flexibacter flexilis]SFC61895.1 ATP-binding cassette, subfamily B [Flexibacter flexilis DSM 6793]
MKSLKRLNKYFRRYKFYLVTGTFFIILSNIFAIIPAQIIRHSFNLVKEAIGLYWSFNGLSSQSFIYEIFASCILFYGILIVVMALLRGLFLFLMRQTIIVMSRHVEYDQKNEIFQHYQSLPLSFYRKNNTGDLMARIAEDVSKVRMYVGPAVMYFINLVTLFVMVIGYMLAVNVELTVYVLLPLPLLSVSIYYVNNIINKRSEEIQRSLSNLSVMVQEAFSGIRVLKAFVRENDSTEKFTQESNNYWRKSLDLSNVNALFFPLIMALVGLSTIITVYVGGLQVMKGNITTGNIAEFVIYVNMLTWPVTSLGWVTSLAQRAAASQQRINEFLDIQTDIISKKNEKPALRGDIRFDNVHFVYPDSGIEALKGISFEVKAGESLAILGTTGSGKSTIAALIGRMYDPAQGGITIDEHNIKDLNVQYLRSQMAYVPQDVFLFSDTVRNNIAFGADKISEEVIQQAIDDADLRENLSRFPEGLDTKIGERGITLSGGQKQRVSIARAIVLNPKVLVLDDCLSAVDTKTENIILNNLQRIMKDKTSVIISHRVSTAKLADKIVILDEGRIVEQGTHQCLMEANGFYKELYDKQLNLDEV